MPGDLGALSRAAESLLGCELNQGGNVVLTCEKSGLLGDKPARKIENGVRWEDRSDVPCLDSLNLYLQER